VQTATTVGCGDTTISDRAKLIAVPFAVVPLWGIVTANVAAWLPRDSCACSHDHS